MTSIAATALTQYWNKEDTILFLGPWCTRYDRKPDWEGLSYRHMDSLWSDAVTYRDAYQRSDDVCEQLLACLAPRLNRMHGLSHDIRYWRIVVGEWVWRYVHVMYDRYHVVEQALHECPSATSVLMDPQHYCRPKDNMDFMNLCYTDRFNQQIFSWLLERKGVQGSYSSQLPREVVPLKASVRSYLAGLKNQWLCRQAREKATAADIVLCHAYISDATAGKLIQKSQGRWGCMTFDQRLPHGVANPEWREQLTEESEGDDFFKVCLKFMTWAFPLAYLEMFPAIRTGVLAETTFVPKGIISAAGWRFNVKAGIYIAELVNKGTQLLGWQHGGGYGTYACDPMLDSEQKACDSYLTWGWAVKSGTSLPVPELSEAGSRAESTQPDSRQILYVLNTRARYRTEFQSSTGGETVPGYLEWQQRFLANVNDGVRHDLVVRLYPRDFGWAERRRLTEARSDISLSPPRTSYMKELKNSRLIVCDHNHTTFLQSMAMNIPTLIFWNPQIWTLSDEARQDFDDLAEVGIFHTSPESAANFLNANHESVERWWFSSSVQDAVSRFRRTYAQTHPQWDAIWITTVENMVQKNTTSARPAEERAVQYGTT